MVGELQLVARYDAKQLAMRGVSYPLSRGHAEST